MSIAACPAEVSDIMRNLPGGRTLTVFVLNDRLDERLCNAIAEVTAWRKASHASAAHYGIFSAFTAEQLAWLMVKTWALSLGAAPDVLTFSDWDFATAQTKTRRRQVVSGTTVELAVEAPWSDPSIDVLMVRAHGAPFDVLLGDTVLCGHLAPALPELRVQRAPSCFHDGGCFRIRGDATSPSKRLQAVDATPLLWCFDSCASLPFADSAFGNGTSYAFGLVAGCAAAVIAPYLDITTIGGLTHRLEALLATGATLGEVAGAACSFEPSVGFDRFLLIGSPDLRLFPRRDIVLTHTDGAWTCQLRGQGQSAWRISVPKSLHGAHVCVVNDDGADCWSSARCVPLSDGSERSLLVTLDAPADVDGWLTVAASGATPDSLVARARQVETSLAMLPLYPFVADSADDISHCRQWARALRHAAGDPGRLRSRSDSAMALAGLRLALDHLHRGLATQFLAEVAVRDVSLDRIPGEGFLLEATVRDRSPCPTCKGALYVTVGRWRESPSHVRRWVQCANCSGIALEHTDCAVDVSAPTASVVQQGEQLEISIGIRNRTDTPMPVVVAGLSRRGRVEWASGPKGITLAPNQAIAHRLHLPLRDAGVISYRVLVLCDACVGLFALKHVVKPDDVRRFASAPQSATIDPMDM